MPPAAQMSVVHDSQQLHRETGQFHSQSPHHKGQDVACRGPTQHVPQALSPIYAFLALTLHTEEDIKACVSSTYSTEQMLIKYMTRE